MDAIFWAILLLVLGIMLILAEVFLPSGGLLSVLAATALVASIVVAFTGGVREGVIMLIANTVVVPLIIVGALRYWPNTPIGRLILIQRPENPDDVLPDTEAYRSLRSLIGRRGRAASKMLPSGAVKIDGRTYDAVSDGFPIDAGQTVHVVEIRTNRLVVRPFDGPLEGPLDDADERRESAAAEDVLAQPADSLGIEGLEEPLA